MIMECTCAVRNGPSRAAALGFPRAAPEEHAEQPCPFSVLVLRGTTRCRCCQLCTLLCLPRKTIGLGRKRPELAELYPSLREIGC